MNWPLEQGTGTKVETDFPPELLPRSYAPQNSLPEWLHAVTDTRALIIPPIKYADRCRLLTDAKTPDDLDIALRIDPAQVIQQAPATADHGQQTTPAGIVLVMGSHVLGQAVDARGQQGDLDFGRTRVVLRTLVIVDNGLFTLFRDRHGAYRDSSARRAIEGLYR